MDEAEIAGHLEKPLARSGLNGVVRVTTTDRTEAGA